MLSLNLSPSRWLTAALLGAHGLTLILVWIMAPSPWFPVWLAMLLSALVVASCTYHLRKNALLQARSAVVTLRLRDDDTLEAQTAAGGMLEGRVQAGSLVSPYLVIVKFLPEGKRFARFVVILPDMLAAEPFRALRVHLRWKCLREGD